MVISEKKSIDEIIGYLKQKENIIVIGCSECATVCQVGGDKEVAAMAKLLDSRGKNILACLVLSPACHLLATKRELRKYKDQLVMADAVLSLTCGNGTQTISKSTDIPVYPGTNTKFIGETQRIGKFEKACMACGECKLGWTAGICPITKCAKGLVNGPCGGSKEGRCEVNPEWDCAWILIYERLKEMGMLDNLIKLREARSFKNSSGPEKINLRRKKTSL